MADGSSSDPGSLTATVAIVGGGASGTLTALNILRASRDPNLRIVLFDADPGRHHLGVAYGTTDERHLLNLRALMMSAFPDEPDHFATWARRADPRWGPTDFLPRMMYGRYLRDLVRELGGDRLRVVSVRVEDVITLEGGFEVVTDGPGATAFVRHVVLAPGVADPPRLRTAEGEPVPDARWHQPTPWDLAALAGVAEDAAVVIVGSGLTAVDVALTLLEESPRRRVCMVSRGGELPKAHLDEMPGEWAVPIPSGALTADGLATLVRGQIALAKEQGVNWRAVVDGIRPHSQSIWRRLDESQRRRFLAEYVRTWLRHRNRMAPAVAARIGTFIAAGRLTVHDGGLRSVADLGERCRVRLAETTLEADTVVNCTGPMTDITRTIDPLLRSLLDRGTIGPDSLGLGMACTELGEVIARGGRIVPGMYVVGPPSIGTVWEAISVPEIRNQTARLAEHLTGPVSGHPPSVPVGGRDIWPGAAR